MRVDLRLTIETQPSQVVAVGQHLGEISGGHYICWVKHRGGWIVYDDSQASWVAGRPPSNWWAQTVVSVMYRSILMETVFVRSDVQASLKSCLEAKSKIIETAKMFSFLRVACAEIKIELGASSGAGVAEPPDVDFGSYEGNDRLSDQSQDAEDEDAPDPDTNFSGEVELEEGVYLPHFGDSITVFHQDVERLLQVFAASKSKDATDACEKFLASLGRYSPQQERLGPRASLARLQRGVETVRTSGSGGMDALQLVVPFWEAHDYRICVLCEAVARTTGIPSVFFLDSLRATTMSVLHKKASVTSSGYVSKARPWFFGVGDPGTGKSHAADALGAVCLEMCERNAEYAGGDPPNFHVIRTRTYAAFEDTIKDSAGYGLVVTGEGKPLLCPTWPSRGTFDNESGLPFDRLMDAAYGKGFGGETKHDRVQAKKAKKDGSAVAAAYQSETNIELGLIVQDSVYLDWLVAGEAHQHIGLASRFLITFAKGRMVGELRYRDFNEHVFRPIASKVVEETLKRWSPKHLDIMEREANTVDALL